MLHNASSEESESEFSSLENGRSNRIEIADGNSCLNEHVPDIQIRNSEETESNTVIYYVDLDNVPTWYISEEEKNAKKNNKGSGKSSTPIVTAKEILDCVQNGYSESVLYNYHDDNLNSNMLNTALTTNLKSEGRFCDVSVVSGKNSADIAMVVSAVRDHSTKPINWKFIFVSGDRGFGAIAEEFVFRRVVVINPHQRMSSSQLQTLINDPDQKNEGKTKLWKCVEELSTREGLSKVIFVLSLSTQLPEQVKVLDPGTVYLRFSMEGNDSEGDGYVFLTKESHKEDAPLFLLGFAIVSMHFKIDKSVVFEIRSCMDIPYDVLRNEFPGRKVEIHIPQSQESELVPSQHNERSNCTTQEGSTDVSYLSVLYKMPQYKKSLELNTPNIGANRSDLVQSDLHKHPKATVLKSALLVFSDQYHAKHLELNTSKHMYYSGAVKCERKETLTNSNSSRPPELRSSPDALTNGTRPQLNTLTRHVPTDMSNMSYANAVRGKKKEDQQVLPSLQLWPALRAGQDASANGTRPLLNSLTRYGLLDTHEPMSYADAVRAKKKEDQLVLPKLSQLPEMKAGQDASANSARARLNILTNRGPLSTCTSMSYSDAVKYNKLALPNPPDWSELRATQDASANGARPKQNSLRSDGPMQSTPVPAKGLKKYDRKGKKDQ